MQPETINSKLLTVLKLWDDFVVRNLENDSLLFGANDGFSARKGYKHIVTGSRMRNYRRAACILDCIALDISNL